MKFFFLLACVASVPVRNRRAKESFESREKWSERTLPSTFMLSPHCSRVPRMPKTNTPEFRSLRTGTLAAQATFQYVQDYS